MKIKTKHDFILASESPRRKEIFSRLGIPFEVQPSGIEEKLDGNFTPEELAINIATMKATAIAEKNPHAVVIGADTTVRIGEDLLEKPTSVHQAKQFMKLLSGNVHDVITGVSIHREGKSLAFAETTHVKFYELSDEQIDAYVESGDSLDKAGGYGIQTMSGLFVEKIEGDYNNVVGLPISHLFQTLLTLQLIEIDKGDN